MRIAAKRQPQERTLVREAEQGAEGRSRALQPHVEAEQSEAEAYGGAKPGTPRSGGKGRKRAKPSDED